LKSKITGHDGACPLDLRNYSVGLQKLLGGNVFMHLRLLVWILFIGLAYSQAAPMTKNPIEESGPATAPQSQVAPDDPVITVNDFCPSGTLPDGSCKTIVTRAQFEKLTEALQPGMSLPVRLQVANSYAKIMQMAAAAENRGLEHSSVFAEEMRYARMQLLSQDLSRALQEEANHISDTELEDYYEKNRSAFEEATVARIFIPHTKQLANAGPKRQSMIVNAHATARAEETKATTASGEAQNQLDELFMTELAADLRRRAANDEDPEKLQAEAYAAAGVPGVIPQTAMQHVRRATLPPQHESVMDLKPGEVSQVFSDPGGGHFIYKMIGKWVLTFENAKPEIRAQISTQRFRDSMKPFQDDTIFNDAYFNPPGRLTTQPHRNPKDRRKNTAELDHNQN
jgi:hypothetical protein